MSRCQANTFHVKGVLCDNAAKNNLSVQISPERIIKTNRLLEGEK